MLRTLRKSSTRKQSARAAVSINSVSAREVSGVAWLTRSANKSLDSCETWRTCRGSIQREVTDEEEKAEGVGLELEARRRSDQMIKAHIYRENIDDWVGRPVWPLALSDVMHVMNHVSPLPKEEESSDVKVSQLIAPTKITRIRRLLMVT